MWQRKNDMVSVRRALLMRDLVTHASIGPGGSTLMNSKQHPPIPGKSTRESWKRKPLFEKLRSCFFGHYYELSWLIFEKKDSIFSGFHFCDKLSKKDRKFMKQTQSWKTLTNQSPNFWQNKPQSKPLLLQDSCIEGNSYKFEQGCKRTVFSSKRLEKIRTEFDQLPFWNRARDSPCRWVFWKGRIWKDFFRLIRSLNLWKSTFGPYWWSRREILYIFGDIIMPLFCQELTGFWPILRKPCIFLSSIPFNESIWLSSKRETLTFIDLLG